jgi:ADP-heptose:LPS heptosyltransferase
VLVLRYDRIGDMILSTGIIKAIALAQPTVVVDVLASAQNCAVLEGNPYVGHILTIDRQRPWTWITVIRRMRRLRYDAVIDVMVMAPSLTTTLVMWLSGARQRIGLGDRGNQAALTLPVARIPSAVHYVDHSAALLAAFGVDPLSVRRWHASRTDGPRTLSPRTEPEELDRRGWGIWRPEIFLTAAEITYAEHLWRNLDAEVPPAERSGHRLVVNVSAGAAWRYWPAEFFIETLTAIRATFPQLQCLLIGAPQDSTRMEVIARACGVSVAHTARSREMMAIVATGDMVFTADTAVTHVASALDKPTLAMFARAKEDLWGPYAIPGGVVSTPARSLQSLQVASVLPALLEVIRLSTRRSQQQHRTVPLRPLLEPCAACCESPGELPMQALVSQRFKTGRYPRLARVGMLSLVALIATPNPARAGGGPLGIDSRLTYDNNGIWARSNQVALIDSMIGVVAAGALWEAARTAWERLLAVGGCRHHQRRCRHGAQIRLFTRATFADLQSERVVHGSRAKFSERRSHHDQFPSDPVRARIWKGSARRVCAGDIADLRCICPHEDLGALAK